MCFRAGGQVHCNDAGATNSLGEVSCLNKRVDELRYRFFDNQGE